MENFRIETTNVMIIDANWEHELRIKAEFTDVKHTPEGFMVSVGDDTRLTIPELRQILSFAESEFERASLKAAGYE